MTRGGKEILEKLAGRVIQKPEKKKLPSGRTIEVEKEYTVGGILHWGHETENSDTLQWFRDKNRQAALSIRWASSPHLSPPASNRYNAVRNRLRLHDSLREREAPAGSEREAKRPWPCGSAVVTPAGVPLQTSCLIDAELTSNKPRSAAEGKPDQGAAH